MSATDQSVLGRVVWTPAPVLVMAGVVVIRITTLAGSVLPEGQQMQGAQSAPRRWE